MPDTWVTYRQAERLAKVSPRSLRRWRAEGSVTWRVSERGHVVFLLEDVRRVKREKALRNVPLQRRVAKLQRCGVLARGEGTTND